jgi:hypothetical protein
MYISLEILIIVSLVSIIIGIMLGASLGRTHIIK